MLLKSLMVAYLPACWGGRWYVLLFNGKRFLHRLHRTGAQPAEGGGLAASLNRFGGSHVYTCK